MTQSGESERLLSDRDDYRLILAKRILRLHAHSSDPNTPEITTYGVPVSKLDKEDLIHLIILQERELQILRK